MTRRACMFILLCAACSRSHFGTASSSEPNVGPGATSSSENGSRAKQGSAPHVLELMTDQPAQPTGAAGTPATAQSETQVWVGELWSRYFHLCEPSATHPSPQMDESHGHSERVVLVLDPAAPDGTITGRMRVGEGTLPSEPETWPIDAATADSFYACSQSSFARGGEYSLLEARRTATRLDFELAPSEIWRPWCTRMHYRAWTGCQTGQQLVGQCCPCDVNGCRKGVGTRLAFDFTIAGDTMDTTLDWSATTQVRLKRMR